MDFDSPTHTMKYENLDKKQFRIKKSQPNGYPNLRISLPHMKKNNYEDYYIIISENHKRKNVTYYLMIDKNGNLKNWCRNESELIILH